MFRSVCMVMFLVCCRALNLEMGLSWAKNSDVRICNGHYIWCLSCIQATTYSVPAPMDGLAARRRKAGCAGHRFGHFRG